MLYIFVEGPDDERFVKSVFLNSPYTQQIVCYATMDKKKLCGFINAISHNQNLDYLFFADADGKSLEARKHQVLEKYPCLSSENVIVVQYEIESWYYAGVDFELHSKLKMKDYIENTDQLTKEQFNNKLYQISDRTYTLIQILQGYSISLAKTRNSSFYSFYERIKQRFATAV